MAKHNIENEVPVGVLRGFLSDDERGVLITVKVKPNAAKEKLFVSSGDELTLSVRAQALESAANVRVIEIFSEIFTLPKSKIVIISGHKSRIKRILLCDENAGELNI